MARCPHATGNWHQHHIERHGFFVVNLSTSDTLASVTFSQNARLSVWRFEHPLATSDNVASVNLLGERRFHLHVGRVIGGSNIVFATSFSHQLLGV